MTLSSQERGGHLRNLEGILKLHLWLLCILIPRLYDVLLGIDVEFLKLRLESLAPIATAQTPVDVLYVAIDQRIILPIEHHHISTLRSIIIYNEVIIIVVLKVGICILCKLIKVIILLVAALLKTTSHFRLFARPLHCYDVFSVRHDYLVVVVVLVLDVVYLV